MESYAETYMKHRAPELDPAWQVSAGQKFLESKQRRKSSERAREKTRKFKNILKVFVKSTKVESIKGFDVERHFTWTDVQSIANEGLERDAERGKWRRHPARFIGRTLQNSAPVLQLVLDFLPNNEFTSILCGALALVFNAAQRIKDVREKIHKCFENLPYIIKRTERHVNIYAENSDVWEAAEDLYLGILEGVEKMLTWIDESACGKYNLTLLRAFADSEVATALKSMFLPHLSGQNVDEHAIKECIDENISKFEVAIADALHSRIANVDKIVEAAVSTAVQHLFDFEREARQEQVQTNAQMLSALHSNRAFLTSNQLRDIVGVDAEIVKLDVEVAVLDAEQAFSDSTAGESAASIMQHPKFRKWLYTNRSDMLLVRWGAHLNFDEETSCVLSLLSGLLYRALSQGAPALPVIHFCGQHNGSDDPFSNPGGVLRYLSAQLLDAEPDRVDLSAFNLNIIQGIQASNFQYLQFLFRTALMAASGRFVFLIVDDISCLEGTPWEHDFGIVIRFWRDLANYFNRGIPGHTGPIFKILLTNPSASRYAEQWLAHEDCVLDLDDEGNINETTSELGSFTRPSF
ncbi:hypothetical protein SUNI508_13201 [Seiridium unicorne]|uniref:Uncharacterized protein n=1 Tax=Seiridium unicorne TaxID=138068 RepID=A0ABR2VER8_9PEZI